MSRRIEELDWRETPMGELTLRRRTDPVSGADVHEVKLGDEFLMSSLFTAAEEELARLAIGRLPGQGLDVVVGGLGLGYTAAAVLDHDAVGSMVVVEALEPVLDWHRDGLVPVGPRLTGDARTRLVHGDFFALMAQDPGVRRWDAVVLDVDHSPRHVLHPSHAAFYSPAGTRRLREHLRPGGVFALWSNDPPDTDYLAVLRDVLTDVDAVVITFPNPLQGGDSTNTVYLGTRAPD